MRSAAQLLALTLLFGPGLGCQGEIVGPERDAGAPPARGDAGSDVDAAAGDTDGGPGDRDAGLDGDAAARDAGAPTLTDGGCLAMAEACNGVDDDCDGRIDEALTQRCGTDRGVCEAGVVTCAGGAFPMCMPVVGPGPETCDGADEDCDGMTDEGIAPRTCGTNVGRCMTGTRACAGGAFGACMGNVGPRAERCDGIDDDCDGSTDEGVAPRTCGTNVGACRTGTRRCAGGSFGACMGNIGPSPEGTTPDGIDDDCDGAIDEGTACATPAEAEQRRLTNRERTSRGLGALSCDRAITRAARAHAQDMCANDYFSHTGRDGSTARIRMRRTGSVFTRSGENIALASSTYTPAAVTADWMASPGHRANILDGRFGRIGVGVARGCRYTDPASGSVFTVDIWVQNFAN